jgi:hypothetical protein
LIALAFVTLGEASPWVREPWGSYLKLGASRFMAAEHGSTHVVAYGELGLPGRLGLTVSVPWVESAAEDRWFTYQNRDFGDAEFALTRAILPGPWALSASLGARVPLYPDRTGQREASWGSLASRFPSPGDGTVDLDGRIEFGRGLRIGGWGGWVEASAGYRHRLGDPVDGLVGGLRAGVVPRRGEADAGWMGVEVQGVARLEDDPDTRTWLRTGAFGAVRLPAGVAVEATVGWIPFAEAAAEGVDVGLALSWMR